MDNSLPRPAPSPPPVVPEMTLYEADHEAFAARQIISLPGEEVEQFKTYSWRVSWHKQAAASIRSPRFEFGGHQWTVTVRPNSNEDLDIVSIILEHETPELLEGRDLCTRVMISMSSPHDTLLKQSYLDQGTFRFTRERRVFGFPDFASREKLVKRCVDEQDDSIITVFLKELKDPTGFRSYHFHASGYDSRRETDQVTLASVSDYVDVGLLHLYQIPEIREMVYRMVPESSNCPVFALQALFYSLEVAADAVTTSRLLGLLPAEVISSGSSRCDALGFAYKALTQLDADHRHRQNSVDDLLCTRIVCPSTTQFGETKLGAMDIFSVGGPGERNVLEDIERTFVRDPSPDDCSTPWPQIRTVIFDFAPFLPLKIRTPFVSGGDAPRVTFPITLDLNSYLPSNYDALSKFGATPRTARRSNIYRLHTVIMQLPDQNIPPIIAQGGRVQGPSYAFIRPAAGGPWFLHRHERVVPVTEKEVLETAFGGRGASQTKKLGAAVSLVYVDEEYERTRPTKQPKAPYLTRQWVKNSIPVEEDENSGLSDPDPMTLIAIVAGVGIMAALIASRLFVRWKR